MTGRNDARSEAIRRFSTRSDRAKALAERTFTVEELKASPLACGEAAAAARFHGNRSARDALSALARADEAGGHAA